MLSRPSPREEGRRQSWWCRAGAVRAPRRVLKQAADPPRSNDKSARGRRTPVCSDETVADPDAVVANTSGLGFPVTTNAKEIATFLRRRSGTRVVSSAYQSWPEIAKALRLGRVPGFDWSLPMSGIAAPPDPSHLTSAPC